ncbi:hypothetical protein H0H92_007265 [Tricholoma furcatifolium]|nr:hypothetical protein H0H92_007265 [Tricholoma furcatifolium]
MSSHNPQDWTTREKRPSPLGSTVFVGLRITEPLFQHAILSKNLGSSLINRLGGETIPLGTPANEILGLSPYRLVLFLMSAGCSLKQLVWLGSIGEQEMPLRSAFFIAAANTISNGLNSLLFITRATSAAVNGDEDFGDPDFPSLPLIVGTTAFVAGTLIELVSELQRKYFKKDPKNKGKNYSGGLFSLSRHINYTGHILMRGGYALAAGGWIWGGIITAVFARDFAVRAIPILDDYCQKRYGDSWSEYKRAVPYKLIPGLY